MTASQGYLAFVTELLAPLGPVSVKRMFGGACLYAGGLVFAFVDGDALYFKTDEPGRGAFEREGMGPFTYVTKHGPGTLASYWRVPERLYDEPDELVAWARRALTVSSREAAAKLRDGKGRAPGATTKKKPQRLRRREVEP
jgi:DNA transformation protein